MSSTLFTIPPPSIAFKETTATEPIDPTNEIVKPKKRTYFEPRTTVVKLKRKNGKVIQSCDVYIGRTCTMGGWNLPQSKWHNPFPVSQYGIHTLEKFRQYISSNDKLMSEIEQLRGKTLGV